MVQFNTVRAFFCSLAIILLATHASSAQNTTPHTEADAKQLVSRAIAAYSSQGRSVFKTISNPAGDYADGSLYVFVIEYEGKTLAHAGFPDQVGNDANRTLDSSGEAIYPSILKKVTEKGAWVTYKYINPLNSLEQVKRTWVVLFDDLVFGAGLYVN